MIFTIISFFLAIAGFILQLKDCFKSNKILRDKIVHIFIGIFIGSLIALVSKVTVTLGEEVMLNHVFSLIGIAILSFIILICLLGFILTPDYGKNEFLGFYLIGAAFALMMLIAQASGNESEEISNKYTAGEYFALSNYHIEVGNKSKAFDYSILSRESVEADDPRVIEYNKRISSLYSELYPTGRLHKATSFGIVDSNFPQILQKNNSEQGGEADPIIDGNFKNEPQQ